MKIEKDELTIYDVEALYQEFLELFKNDTAVIDMSNVKKVDMSITQLLVSLQKSCQETSKNFELLHINQEVTDILKSCACDFLLGVNHE